MHYLNKIPKKIYYEFSLVLNWKHHVFRCASDLWSMSWVAHLALQRVQTVIFLR